MEQGPLMLDVDTGVDDAAALALAIGLGADLVAVSTVAGNVPIDRSTSNTRRVLSYLGRADVPVYRGASRPLVASYRDAAHVHGDNGLGGVELPTPPAPEESTTGPEALVRMAARHAGALTLVTLGPLTNLAIALSLRPEIVRQVARLVVMGGAYATAGNVTPHAEFNIYVDPDAAQQVLAAPWPDLTVVGLDVTHRTVLPRATWQAIGADQGAAADLLRAILARTFTERSMTGFYLHDPLAVAVALDPTLVSGLTVGVDVVTRGEHRGRTQIRDRGHVRVATDVDATPFLRRFCAAVGIELIGDPAAAERPE